MKEWDWRHFFECTWIFVNNLKRYFLSERWARLHKIQGIIKNSFHFIREYSENSDTHSPVYPHYYHVPSRARGIFIKRFPLSLWCHPRNHEIYDIERTFPCCVTNHEDLHSLNQLSTLHRENHNFFARGKKKKRAIVNFAIIDFTSEWEK